MNRWIRLAISLWLSLLSVSFATPVTDAPLDPGRAVIRPLLDSLPNLSFPEIDALPVWSDTGSVMKKQTRVKMQGKRGTCAIFATTGIVESLYKSQRGKVLDLSENYLEFLVVNRVKPAPAEGSDIYLDVPAFRRYGAIEQAAWPYEEYDWAASNLPMEEYQRKMSVCGGLYGDDWNGCVITHHRRDLDEFAQRARQFHDENGMDGLSFRNISTKREIKSLLASGHPIVVTIEFFYGAWNHPKMETLGIGARNMVMWSRGIVGTPTDFDIQMSQADPASHSFVIVGYNDEAREYYFKNSWGSTEGSFGAQSDFFGPGTSAGYGRIPYAYADNFGAFYDVELK